LEFGKLNPLIFSLICLLLVGISANFISYLKKNKTFLYIALLPCIYLLIYGIYLVFGTVDLYEDGKINFFIKHPEKKDLPMVFVLLKFYQYIVIIVGAFFSYLYSNFIRK